MTELSNLLTAHVRLEERDLLPLVERLLSEHELSDLATSGRRDV
jgi:hemerythrin-like domain-containing protein